MGWWCFCRVSFQITRVMFRISRWRCLWCNHSRVVPLTPFLPLISGILLTDANSVLSNRYGEQTDADWQLLGTACNFTLCLSLQIKMHTTGDSWAWINSLPQEQRVIWSIFKRRTELIWSQPPYPVLYDSIWFYMTPCGNKRAEALTSWDLSSGSVSPGGLHEGGKGGGEENDSGKRQMGEFCIVLVLYSIYIRL